jgi:hypothetical protein
MPLREKTGASVEKQRRWVKRIKIASVGRAFENTNREGMLGVEDSVDHPPCQKPERRKQ